MPGHNYRMTEFQAALGTVQMAKLSRITTARCAAAARYDSLLTGGPLKCPSVMVGATHVYQSYVALLPTDAAPRRAELIRLGKEKGIETQVGTIHMPLTTYYRSRYGYQPGNFPVTDAVAARSLTLPLHENISPAEQQTVVDIITPLLA
jgi:perosamine synthetase